MKKLIIILLMMAGSAHAGVKDDLSNCNARIRDAYAWKKNYLEHMQMYYSKGNEIDLRLALSVFQHVQLKKTAYIFHKCESFEWNKVFKGINYMEITTSDIDIFNQHF